MKNRTIKLALLLGLLGSQAALAGPHGDDLSRCLVESTNQADRQVLAKWGFSAASQHPAVRSVVTVSEKELDDSNKYMAELLTRLLTQSCRSEAQKALQYEGPVTLQTSFQALGQVAGRELFSSPQVAVAMAAGLTRHLDAKTLATLSSAMQKE